MRLLFFAHLREIAGQGEAEWKLEHSLDAGALWGRLLAAYPGLEPHRATIRLARNCAYAGPETRFEDGDEVALIPPVSGG